MANSNEQLNLNFDYSHQCNALNVDLENIIAPDELKHVDRNCTGTGHNIIDCKISNIDEHLQDVNGLSFSDIKSNGATPLEIPSMIPVISRRLFAYNTTFSFVGVTLKNIFKKEPIDKLYGVNRCQRSLKFNYDLYKQIAFRNKQIILFSSGPDCFIEEIWKKQNNINFFLELKKLNFAMATAINFSIFQGECPFSQNYNLKKSLVTFSNLQKQNIQAIPHVYWGHVNHLKRWVEWLELYPDIKYISINCQLCSHEFTPKVVTGIYYILSHLPQIHIILEGPKRHLLSHLIEVSSSIHIATKWPSEYALNHRRIQLVSSQLKTTIDQENSVEFLLENNFQQYKLFLDKYFFYRKLIKPVKHNSNLNYKNVYNTANNNED